MKKLLNTLYVTTPDAYLSLDGENVVVSKGDAEIGRIPLHNLENICTIGWAGASPALMYACAERNISLCFLSSSFRFRARVIGQSKGNVVLRKTQYRLSDNEKESAKIARNFIFAKICNQKWILERATRNYPMRMDVPALKESSKYLTEIMKRILDTEDLELLRGLEGKAANRYFQHFNDLILQQKDDFRFLSRSRRPPTDNVNALLSFSYTLLANEVTSALESVGFDAYVGFLHRDRPGRASLVLDMMEEFRSVIADRFVLNLINKKIISSKHFLKKESGAVLLTDEGRKIFLKSWQERKQEQITHPRLNEKIPYGLVPYAQALLLARFIRGDAEEYAPFLWK